MKRNQNGHIADKLRQQAARVFFLASFTVLPLSLGGGDVDLGMLKKHVWMALSIACLLAFAFLRIYAWLQGEIPKVRLKILLHEAFEKFLWRARWILAALPWAVQENSKPQAAKGTKKTMHWSPPIRPKATDAFSLQEKPIFPLTTGYIAILLLSLLFSRDRTSAWLGYTVRDESLSAQLLYLFAFYIAARYYRPSEKDFMVVCVTGACIALYGICTYYGYEPLFDGGGLTGQVIRQYIPIGNKTFLSIYNNIILLLSLVLYIRLDGKKRFLFAACGLLAFYMLLCANVDSGYAGFFAALVFAVPFILFHQHHLARLFSMAIACSSLFFLFQWLFPLVNNFASPTRFLLIPVGVFAAICAGAACLCRWRNVRVERRTLRRIYLIVLGIVCVLVWCLLPMLANWSSSLTLKQAAELSRGHLSDDMGSDRGFLWRRAFLLFLQRPVLGHGPDQFSSVFLQAYGAETSVYFDDGSFPDKAHNEYLQRLVDVGLLGLLFSLALQTYLMRRAWKRRADPRIAAVGVVCISYLVQALFTFVNPLSTPMLCLLFGIAYGAGIEPASVDIA